jgi:RNA polymerase sigma factor (sigma-70 family)
MSGAAQGSKTDARIVPDAARDATTDATVVQAVLAGEREAFSLLVQRHQDALFRFARGMGVSRDTAQDLVQDAFVRGFTRLRQCRDASRLRAWLLTILRHLLIDHARDVRRAEVPLQDVGELRGVPPEAELRGDLSNALATLPELLREAFLLRHHHGYSYDEIAVITGARTSAVKMRVHRAREQLRALLDDAGTLEHS